MPSQVREQAAAAGQPVRATETEVLVASIGNDMQVRLSSLRSSVQTEPAVKLRKC